MRFQEQRELHSFKGLIELRFLLEQQLLQLSLINFEEDRSQNTEYRRRELRGARREAVQSS